MKKSVASKPARKSAHKSAIPTATGQGTIPFDTAGELPRENRSTLNLGAKEGGALQEGDVLKHKGAIDVDWTKLLFDRGNVRHQRAFTAGELRVTAMSLIRPIDGVRHAVVIDPINVRKLPDNALMLTDGHRRVASLHYLKQNYPDVVLPVRIAAIVDQSSTDEQTKIINQLLFASGKPLSISEKASAVKKLAAMGMSDADIQQQCGVSSTFMGNLKLLSEAPDLLHELAKAGNISENLAIELVRHFRRDDGFPEIMARARLRAIESAKAKPNFTEQQAHIHFKILPKHIPEYLAGLQARSRTNTNGSKAAVKRIDVAQGILGRIINASVYRAAQKREARIAVFALEVASGRRSTEELFDLLKIPNAAEIAGSRSTNENGRQAGLKKKTVRTPAPRAHLARLADTAVPPLNGEISSDSPKPTSRAMLTDTDVPRVCLLLSSMSCLEAAKELGVSLKTVQRFRDTFNINRRGGIGSLAFAAADSPETKNRVYLPGIALTSRKQKGDSSPNSMNSQESTSNGALASAMPSPTGINLDPSTTQKSSDSHSCELPKYLLDKANLSKFRALVASGATLDAMAKEFDISKKTVQRSYWALGIPTARKAKAAATVQ